MRKFLFNGGLLLSLFACRPAPPSGSDIIDKCIEAHGGNKFRQAIISFDFRSFHITIQNNGSQFKYEREFTDSALGKVYDVLTNEGFDRKINGKSQTLDSAARQRYEEGLNAIVYFASLPFKLQDPAAIKEYVGEVQLDGQPYDKIKVSFRKEGGGKDYGDVFYYWIHQTRHTMDYLAYSNGGARFRKAIHPQIVGGIRFQDYINYKGAALDSGAVGGLDKKYQAGLLEILSSIEQKNIQVKMK